MPLGEGISGLDIESTGFDLATKRFVELAKLDKTQADDLVGFAIQAYANDAFELIMGSSIVPTTLLMSRVSILKYVCEKMKRPLSRVEVQILFRATPNSAAAIITTMNSIYTQSMQPVFVAHMRSDNRVEPGDDTKRPSWIVSFGQRVSYETACNELQKFNLEKFVKLKNSSKQIEFLQGTTATTGNFDILKMLGLPKPKLEAKSKPIPLLAARKKKTK